MRHLVHSCLLARWLHILPGHYFALLLLLMVALGSHSARAQNFPPTTLTNFTIDGSTSATWYISNSAGAVRRSDFSVILTKYVGSRDDPYQINIYRVGGNQAQNTFLPITTRNVSGPTPVGSSVSYVITGTIDITSNNLFFGGYTGLKVVLNPFGLQTYPSSNTITFTLNDNPSNPSAASLSNFSLDNATSISLSSTPRVVTARVTLTRDPGLADNFWVRIGGNNRGLVIQNSYTNTQGTACQVPSTGWALVNGKRRCSLTWTFSVSSNDVSSVSNALVVQATTTNVGGGFLLANDGNPVALSVVTVPCQSDVFVQNVLGFSGTKNSGANLYAGRAVTNTVTTGDVIISSFSSAEFTAREAVVLADGFIAPIGSTFAALIDGAACSSFAPEDPTGPSAARQVSMDEGMSHALPASARVSAAENSSLASVAIYPIPANDEINVTLLETGAAHELRVYNSIGDEVQRVRLKPGQTKVDVRRLPAGIYYLYSSSNNGIVKARFSIER